MTSQLAAGKTRVRPLNFVSPRPAKPMSNWRSRQTQDLYAAWWLPMLGRKKTEESVVHLGLTRRRVKKMSCGQTVVVGKYFADRDRKTGNGTCCTLKR